MDERGTPNTFGYDSDGVRLPYANHRPDYAPGQVEKVWNNTRANQIDDIEAGRLGAPPSLPGPDQLWVKDMTGDWKLIEWNPEINKSRKGIWDMGHLPDAKYAELRESYLSGEITKEKFLESDIEILRTTGLKTPSGISPILTNSKLEREYYGICALRCTRCNIRGILHHL